MEVYRLVHKKHAGRLLASGCPGRWNRRGVPLIYTSGTRSLAYYENYIRMGQRDLEGRFVLETLIVPDDLQGVTKVPSRLVPGEFNYLIYP